MEHLRRRKVAEDGLELKLSHNYSHSIYSLGTNSHVITQYGIAEFEQESFITLSVQDVIDEDIKEAIREFHERYFLKGVDGP